MTRETTAALRLNPESLPCSSINVPSFENDVHILRDCTGGGSQKTCHLFRESVAVRNDPLQTNVGEWPKDV